MIKYLLKTSIQIFSITGNQKNTKETHQNYNPITTKVSYSSLYRADVDRRPSFTPLSYIKEGIPEES